MRRALVLVGLLVPAAAQAQQPKVVEVGMVKSLFRGVADVKVKLMTVGFGHLMEQHTGLRAKVVTDADALELGERLEKGKLDLALFHGYEFAWAQQKYPRLKPLFLALNHKAYRPVHLVTRADSKITRVEDLKGKPVSLPRRSVAQCYLFADSLCDRAGSCTADKYFGEVIEHDNVETGLDDVVRGKVDAAIVDSLMLEFYGSVKPAVMPLLKTVEKSEPFPSAVVAYREGGLDQRTLDAFRDGMFKANKDLKSRALMTLWRMTAFAPVPGDYQKVVENIRQAYPAPAAGMVASGE
jgi:ABC-type phosphate/phosphonate transport system substrate-binding protein